VGQSAADKSVSTEAEDIVAIRHQPTTGEDSRLRRVRTCCSELQSVWISDSAIVTCSYDL
jgi:hypothetical protein